MKKIVVLAGVFLFMFASCTKEKRTRQNLGYEMSSLNFFATDSSASRDVIEEFEIAKYSNETDRPVILKIRNDTLFNSSKFSPAHMVTFRMAWPGYGVLVPYTIDKRGKITIGRTELWPFSYDQEVKKSPASKEDLVEIGARKRVLITRRLKRDVCSADFHAVFIHPYTGEIKKVHGVWKGSTITSVIISTKEI